MQIMSYEELKNSNISNEEIIKKQLNNKMRNIRFLENMPDNSGRLVDKKGIITNTIKTIYDKPPKDSNLCKAIGVIIDDKEIEDILDGNINSKYEGKNLDKCVSLNLDLIDEMLNNDDTMHHFDNNVNPNKVREKFKEIIKAFGYSSLPNVFLDNTNNQNFVILDYTSSDVDLEISQTKRLKIIKSNNEYSPYFEWLADYAVSEYSNHQSFKAVEFEITKQNISHEFFDVKWDENVTLIRLNKFNKLYDIPEDISIEFSKIIERLGFTIDLPMEKIFTEDFFMELQKGAMLEIFDCNSFQMTKGTWVDKYLHNIVNDIHLSHNGKMYVLPAFIYVDETIYFLSNCVSTKFKRFIENIKN